MSATTLISVEEYLSTSYRPDCDYIDGEVRERNLGEQAHSELQGEIWNCLNARYRKRGMRVWVEQRVQVAARRFRIPDVCVTVGKPDEQVYTTPPFICIEILSRDDTFAGTLERVQDYLSFGVPYVWVLDPRTRRAIAYTSAGSQEATGGVLKTSDPEIIVDLKEVFAALDSE